MGKTDATPAAVTRDADAPPLKFEQAMAELNGIIERMEGGELPLDKMVDTYKRAATLIGLCRRQLNDAKSEIQKLEKDELQPVDYESDV